MYPTGRCSLGDQCKAPHGQLRPKYKCFFCDVQLHPFAFGCSEIHDDDKVKCISGCGNDRQHKQQQQQQQLEDQQPNKRKV